MVRVDKDEDGSIRMGRGERRAKAIETKDPSKHELHVRLVPV